MQGLMLCFHGFKQTIPRFRRKSKLDDVATQLDCIIEYPKADRLNWGGLNPAIYTEKDLIDLENVINYCHNRYELDHRLYLIGFSDGASFAGTLARYLSAKETYINGVVVYAGLYQECSYIPQQNYNLIYIRGEKDPFVKQDDEDEFSKQYSTNPNFKIFRSNGGHTWDTNVNPMIVKAFS